MDSVELKGSKRVVSSSGDLFKLRAAGNVPGVLYGCGVVEYFSVPYFFLKGIVYTNKKFLINFNLDGEIHKCVIKDVQIHPVSEIILHVDLLKITDKSVISQDINIVQEGIPVGVKNGGLLMKKMKKLKISGLASDIPSVFVIDITNLNGGETLRVSDLDQLKGCKFEDEPNKPLFALKAPRK